MLTRDSRSSGTSGYDVGRRGGRLRKLRVVLVLVGLIGGALLPALAQQMTMPYSVHFATVLNDGWIAIAVSAAYGALGGWAIGALVAHLRGER